ncbi:unnamed protein product [Spirodela intermedia]|uniref:Photosystem I assembly protein Ycf4 n=1 Tax=Spirodela intermedia TaxID=51605 RepID=A0A7I8KBU4_SPIIN|nr:unnamed protein product [Spirodela intermedia]
MGPQYLSDTPHAWVPLNESRKWPTCFTWSGLEMPKPTATGFAVTCEQMNNEALNQPKRTLFFVSPIYHRIFLSFIINDFQSTRVEVKKGPYAPHAIYMEVRIQGTIRLTRADDNSTPPEIEQKAAQLANFLGIHTEVI